MSWVVVLPPIHVATLLISIHEICFKELEFYFLFRSDQYQYIYIYI